MAHSPVSNIGPSHRDAAPLAHALRAMGFPNPKFFIGFIISKPPETAPPLYWHQDGFT